MEKTATSNHFSGTTLLFLHIVQKQKSREMPPRNLTGLIRNKLRDGALGLFFFRRNNAYLKEDNSKSLTQDPKIVLAK